METKSRSTTVSIPGDMRMGWYDQPGHTSHGAVAFGTGSNAQDFGSYQESISYERPGYKGNGTCLHTRTSLEILPTKSVHRDTRFAIPRRVERGPWWLPGFYHDRIRATPSIAQATMKWQEWSDEAIEALLPTFNEGGESLVNSMLELKSIKNLFKFWSRRKSLLKNAAGLHLNYQFGWKPFLSDVQRVRGALDTFQKKVRAFQQDAGKTKRGHYSRYVDLSILSGGLLWAADENGQWRSDTSWSSKPKYCATVDYIYVLPDMADTTNMIKGFLDHLGVQLNASIVWNALPYSFVVDWFFNVGKAVNKLRVDNLKIPATVVGFCHSLKYEWQVRYSFTSKNQFDAINNRAQLVAVRKGLRYERRRDIPFTDPLGLTVKTPNWEKMALGLSLIIQRT